jgi:flagellar biosynthesis GTPase FlhF
MTLKTVTGPSIRAALADARRLFGEDAVLLQSAPAAHGQPASVTVAFDTPAQRAAARRGPRPSAPAGAEPVAPAVPESAPGPRAYGYGAGANRNVRPAAPEPASASAPAPPPAAPPAPAAPPDEVAELRARLAELEAALAARPAAPVTPPAGPPAAPARPPLVLVGPAGSGKTSLALRLGGAPALCGAERPAVLLLAPEADHYADPAPVFWGRGVPVAVVETADDVREALQTFAEADLLIVDTPALPLCPDRAEAAVERLARVLAPLASVEVHLVVDAARAPSALTAETVAALGLAPDAVALTRLDETDASAETWAAHLGRPVRFAASGPDAADLVARDASPGRGASAPAEVPAASPFAPTFVEAPLGPPACRFAPDADAADLTLA